MRKGEARKKAVLDVALDLASEVGVEALSFGVLAKQAGMSKSGLYAHFDTKEQLQAAVVDVAAERFTEVVFVPALQAPRGLPRLEKLFERWLFWEREALPGGCVFIAAAADVDDRPGPVRDALGHQLSRLLTSVARTFRIAVDEGHLREGVDVDQLAFELWGILHVYHQFVRLLDRDDADRRARTAFERVIASAS